jgi:hypothetical protein
MSLRIPNGCNSRIFLSLSLPFLGLISGYKMMKMGYKILEMPGARWHAICGSGIE